MTLSIVAPTAPDASQDEQDTELLRNLAEIHQKFGMHSTAISMLSLSLWIDRDDEQALALLAHSLFQSKDFNNTLLCLERLEASLGALTQVQEMMRVSALALNGQTHEAHRILEQNQHAMEMIR